MPDGRGAARRRWRSAAMKGGAVNIPVRSSCPGIAYATRNRKNRSETRDGLVGPGGGCGRAHRPTPRKGAGSTASRAQGKIGRHFPALDTPRLLAPSARIRGSEISRSMAASRRSSRRRASRACRRRDEGRAALSQGGFLGGFLAVDFRESFGGRRRFLRRRLPWNGVHFPTLEGEIGRRRALTALGMIEAPTCSAVTTGPWGARPRRAISDGISSTNTRSRPRPDGPLPPLLGGSLARRRLAFVAWGRRGRGLGGKNRGGLVGPRFSIRGFFRMNLRVPLNRRSWPGFAAQ